MRASTDAVSAPPRVSLCWQSDVPRARVLGAESGRLIFFDIFSNGRLVSSRAPIGPRMSKCHALSRAEPRDARYLTHTSQIPQGLRNATYERPKLF